MLTHSQTTTVTLDTDGDGVGIMLAIEAAAAKQKEEDEKRRNLIIIGAVSVIVIGLVVGLILKRRSGGSVEVAKDYGYSSSEASPQTQASNVTNQLQILNQWTDDSGYTWRKMSDGSHHYWDGSQWIKHS